MKKTFTQTAMAFVLTVVLVGIASADDILWSAYDLEDILIDVPDNSVSLLDQAGAEQNIDSSVKAYSYSPDYNMYWSVRKLQEPEVLQDEDISEESFERMHESLVEEQALVIEVETGDFKGFRFQDSSSLTNPNDYYRYQVYVRNSDAEAYHFSFFTSKDNKDGVKAVQRASRSLRAKLDEQES